MGTIQLSGVGRSFKSTAAVSDIDLIIEDGGFVVLLGPSGCGKTTLLRMIAGLLEPTAGRIHLDGDDITDLPSKKRDLAMVFQSYALYPHLSVRKNLAFPLKTQRLGAAEIATRVQEVADSLEIGHLLDRKPKELSGGQRQRVAIARALALNPELIVCDEPVSALDVLVQDQILTLLRRLQDELGLSYLFISHDLAVVRLISDYVCVMKDGRVVEAASSEEVFTNPRHPYTRRLLASIPGNELGIAVEADGTHV